MELQRRVRNRVETVILGVPIECHPFPRTCFEAPKAEAAEKQPYDRGPNKQSEVACARSVTGHELPTT
ncbi:hypothetical protein V6N13_009209 [Hibiscus sabdariffa]|uniref:Uncharacterized protein n=1 Tax=Hibiscus sabdariffa TaxID=183260 RepID=A0ABR2DHH9_9ROSI